MTPKQIEIVQSTFEKVVPIADIAAELFYARLFEVDPSLRDLFRGDMKRQGAMLISMVGSAVKGLKNPAAIVPVLTLLGRRHAAYGVTDEHYDTVASALLWTLEQAMGDEFTPETREAWAAAYGLVASVMKIGAREALGKTALAA